MSSNTHTHTHTLTKWTQQTQHGGSWNLICHPTETRRKQKFEQKGERKDVKRFCPIHEHHEQLVFDTNRMQVYLKWDEPKSKNKDELNQPQIGKLWGQSCQNVEHDLLTRSNLAYVSVCVCEWIGVVCRFPINCSNCHNRFYYGR